MFTEQTQYLSALPSAKSPQELGQLMADLLGQCQLPLRHEGDIEVRNLTVNGTITGGGAGGNNYAVATATWVRASGHGSYVTCREATSPTGTLTSDATTFQVYLPRSNAALDPNVYAGDVLQYVTIGGTKYAIGETYLDAQIGSLKPMTHTSVGHGWEQCDGTGSTDDFTNLFVRGSSVYGTTGGSNSHTHTADIDNASPAITGETDLASTGITVDDHPDHFHNARDTPVGITEGTDRDVYGALKCTGKSLVDGSPDVCDDAAAIGDWVHGVNETPHKHGAGTLAVAAHDHTFTIDSASNVPAYITAIWFVRVGPSGEVT